MNNCFKKIGDLSLPLISGILIALVWANIDSVSYEHIIYGEIIYGINLHFLINDVFLVLFFASVTVEIVHGLVPGGNLYPLKNTVANLLGALGGVILPAIIFVTLNHYFGHPEYTHGWAIPTATDVAISLLFAQIIFGKTHPAYSFLLLLAIADDIAGLVIIAFFYPDPELPVKPLWLLLIACAMIISYILRHYNIKNYLFYLLAGCLSWFGLHEANLHASLALIFIIPFIPHSSQNNQQSTLEHFETDFKPIVDYGLFFFGLANAGVAFANISILTIIIFISLLIGKTFGIYIMVKTASLFNFKINKNIGNIDLLLIGTTAGVGLTVSLFIAEIAYTEHVIGQAAKMGALFSLFNGFIALGIAYLLHHGRFTPQTRK